MQENGTNYRATIQLFTVATSIQSFFIYAFTDFAIIATIGKFSTVCPTSHTIYGCSRNLGCVVHLTPLPGSLSETFCIIDEAQNLTPHEIKTIITRAGEGTKMVFTGDIQQIDSPYLDAQSNGLAYMVDKMKGQELFAHINLIKGERSQLSELASDLL